MNEKPRPAAEALDNVGLRAKQQLTRWSEEEQQLFSQIWEQSDSELKRELLRRALAQGHLADELQAFAGALRRLTDAEAFEACTLRAAQAPYESVDSRLWAEADPIYAWILNGYPLVVSPSLKNAPLKGAKFSKPPPEVKRPRLDAVVESACRIGEDLFNAAGASFGLSFTEQSVDQGAQTLHEVLALVEASLQQGIPVPVLLGRQVGDFQRYGLLVDAEHSSSDVVYWLYDPTQDNLVSFRLSETRGGNPWIALAQERLRITTSVLPQSVKT